jgi:hypothetical protein
MSLEHSWKMPHRRLLHGIFALTLWFALIAPAFAEDADQKASGGPWIVPASILFNGHESGAGVYLGSGLIITAAHLTAVDAKMSVRLVGLFGTPLEAKVLKQGSLAAADLSLLSVDVQKLPARFERFEMRLCEAPAWPGDPVIVADSAGKISRSHIVWPHFLPSGVRTKFSTWINDVAATGNSGSGVFDPSRKCLLGIMSRKYMDIAKYFVPASEIRDFMPAEFKP